MKIHTSVTLLEPNASSLCGRVKKREGELGIFESHSRRRILSVIVRQSIGWTDSEAGEEIEEKVNSGVAREERSAIIR